MRQRLSLKARALQLLSQREHSRIELRRKLLAHTERLAQPQRPGQRPGSAAVDGGEATSLQPASGVDEGERGSTRTRRAPPSPEVQASLEALLDGLAASGLLSESRFVEARVRTRAVRHGNLRITQELARHGLRLSADEAQDLKSSEYGRAKDVWERKFGAQPTVDAADRARQMRFLAGRGFSAEVIRRVLRADEDED